MTETRIPNTSSPTRGHDTVVRTESQPNKIRRGNRITLKVSPFYLTNGERGWRGAVALIQSGPKRRDPADVGDGLCPSGR